MTLQYTLSSSPTVERTIADSVVVITPGAPEPNAQLRDPCVMHAASGDTGMPFSNPPSDNAHPAELDSCAEAPLMEIQQTRPLYALWHWTTCTRSSFP